MSMIGAFSRSRVVLKKDVEMAMTKWWKKQRPAEAEITMHLSPHEQRAVAPWLTTFPKKVVDRVPIYAWPVGMAAFTYSVMVVAETLDANEDLEHRF